MPEKDPNAFRPEEIDQHLMDEKQRKSEPTKEEDEVTHGVDDEVASLEDKAEEDEDKEDVAEAGTEEVDEEVE